MMGAPPESINFKRNVCFLLQLLLMLYNPCWWQGFSPYCTIVDCLHFPVYLQSFYFVKCMLWRPSCMHVNTKLHSTASSHRRSVLFYLVYVYDKLFSKKTQNFALLLFWVFVRRKRGGGWVVLRWESIFEKGLYRAKSRNRPLHNLSKDCYTETAVGHSRMKKYLPLF